MTVPQRLFFSAQLSKCNLATWVAVKTSVWGSWGIALEFFVWNSWISCLRSQVRKKRESGILFEISHRFAWFWHLMTGDIINQTWGVLTDAHMLAHWTQHTGPSPRSKCTAQLPSLNLVNGMFFSNSDSAVQSAGYNSAQSPTNWESIHGKDPSILCRASSRLSIALDDKTQNAKSKIARWHEKLIAIIMHACVWNLRNWPATHYKFCVSNAPVCLKILNVRCSCLLLMYVWISLVSGDITTYPILYDTETTETNLCQELSD